MMELKSLLLLACIAISISLKADVAPELVIERRGQKLTISR